MMIRYKDYLSLMKLRIDVFITLSGLAAALAMARGPLSVSHTAWLATALMLASASAALFNQYAGPDQPLTNEINSFDQCDGHPEMQGLYHYHLVPDCLIEQVTADGLVGFLLDGFPVYGPEENGAAITNADLDTYHGHSHATPEYPDGIYHYHVTDEAPYINGDGFYGTPGTVER